MPACAMQHVRTALLTVLALGSLLHPTGAEQTVASSGHGARRELDRRCEPRLQTQQPGPSRLQGGCGAPGHCKTAGCVATRGVRGL